MPANSSLNLTSLDFDTLKANFIQFLQNNSQFKDYNYTGSNINTMLDVLSYNTYLNAFYLNMIGSEGFLSSAQLRNSVVSKAKELNYVPKSSTSAVAVINVTFNTSGINSIMEIPANTQFVGKNANGTFFFTTDRNYTVTSTSNTYTFSGVNVYEGTYFTDSFVVNSSLTNQPFILSNQNVDSSSVKVTVTNAGNTQVYSPAASLANLNSNSMVFFTQEYTNGRYEIEFGDGVFGYYPLNGSVITATYRVTNADAGNGVNTLNISTDLGLVNGGTVSSANVTVVSNSAGGSPPETIDSIKFRAPRSYQTQDRAVTVDDYRNLILTNFSDIEDVSIYGGEKVPNTVQYGTTFVVPSTFTGAPLSDLRKADVVNFLASKKIVSIKTQVIDPEYIYIVPTVDLSVNFNTTTFSPADYKTITANAIINFNTLNLQKFNTTFRHSALTNYINAADSSIVSNLLTATVYKLVNVSLNIAAPIKVSFHNAIQPGSISSTPFVLNDGNEYILTDYNPAVAYTGVPGRDGSFSYYNNNPVIYLQQVSNLGTYMQNYVPAGSIDYTNGIISINNLNIFSLVNGVFKVEASTLIPDVAGILNNIVEIDTSAINVNVINVAAV